MSGAPDLITAIAALVTSMGVIGGGIKFTLVRVDKRIDSLKGEVKDCHEKHARCESEAADLRQVQGRMGVITRLAIEQLNLIDPNNIVTRQLKAELSSLYPFDDRLPEEARALLTKLKGVPYP